MRKHFTLLIALISVATIHAQIPQKMSYQAVIRDTENELVKNQAVGMRLSILSDSTTGTEVYKELFNPNPETNENGLVTVEIGTGVTTDNFANIDWTNGAYYLKTEIDPTGGTNYTVTGVSQFLTVPYAFYAKNAQNADIGGIRSYGTSTLTSFTIASTSTTQGQQFQILQLTDIPAGTYGVYFSCPVGNTSISSLGVNLSWAITKNNATPVFPYEGIASSLIPPTNWNAQYIFGQSGYNEITLDSTGTIELKAACYGNILSGTVYTGGKVLLRAIRLD